MKFYPLLFLACLFVSNSSSAFEDDNRILPDNYTIVSDKKDKSIQKGSFVLTGTVKMFSSNNPLGNVLIGCLSSGIWVRSDADGNFSVTLESTDTLVYFYKQGWTEIVIEDYIFKDQHRVVIDVWLAQEKEQNVKRKPVIYMYSDKDLSASISLDPKGEFTFTYPEYKDGWDVLVKKDGGLQVDNKPYPYLFWEAKSAGMHYSVEGDKLPGFIFESKNVVSFFEEKLGQLGLNQKEMTDFITYWGPVLSHQEYAFVQFVIDEAYNNQIADLNISPKPNSIRRVYILCSGLDSPELGMEVQDQNLESFERNGFTVVEWGGSVLDLTNLTP